VVASSSGDHSRPDEDVLDYWQVAAIILTEVTWRCCAEEAAPAAPAVVLLLGLELELGLAEGVPVISTLCPAWAISSSLLPSSTKLDPLVPAGRLAPAVVELAAPDVVELAAPLDSIAFTSIHCAPVARAVAELELPLVPVALAAASPFWRQPVTVMLFPALEDD
jgi:hypothetical protein